jgi:periplasmic protein TonB
MRHIFWIALSIALLLPSNFSAAQNSSQTESSGSASPAPSTIDDDVAFARFQLLTPGIKPPKAISAPDPKFPDLPADAEPRGTVVLLIGVSTKGRVEAVRVLRSDEDAFEKSAVTTVRKWKFKPAEKSGHPVPVRITVEMKFQR